MWSQTTFSWDWAKRAIWSTLSTLVWPRNTVMLVHTNIFPTVRTRISPELPATPQLTHIWVLVSKRFFGLCAHSPHRPPWLQVWYCPIYTHRAIQTRWPRVSGICSNVLQSGVSALARPQSCHKEAEVWAHQWEENVHAYWGPLQRISM